MASDRNPRCPGCHVTFNINENEWRHDPACLIARQAHGEPLDEASGDDIEVISDPMPPEDPIKLLVAGIRDLVEKYDPDENSKAIETNFGFYVDGYSLHATGKVGEVMVKRYDGSVIVIKSKALTDFFDRRFDPGENDRNLTG